MKHAPVAVRRDAPGCVARVRNFSVTASMVFSSRVLSLRCSA